MTSPALVQQPLRLPPLADVVAGCRGAAGTSRHQAFLEGRAIARLAPRVGPPPAGLRITILMPRVDVGGGARILLEHANRLTDRGHDVLVLAHAAEPEWFALRARFEQVALGLDLADAIPPCDLVVCGYWDQVVAARALGMAPVVHFEQGDFHLFEDLAPEIEQRVRADMAAADVTTTVSGRVARILSERYAVDAAVVHNAVDPAVFSSPGPQFDAGGPYVLCVGWDGNAFKGMAEMRAAWARLREEQPGLQLVWVTPRPPQEPMGTVVVSPSQQQLAALYRGAAVYVCASRYESFPLPPIEAMACGAPVVTTANEGVLEYAVAGSNTLVVPIGDVDGIVAAVTRVLTDPDLSSSLRTAGLATARSFSWDAIVAGLEARYRSAAAYELAPNPGRPTLLLDRAATPLDDRAAARLEQALRTSRAAEIHVPVARPSIEGHLLYSWEPAVTRRGETGAVRLHAPHTAPTPSRLLPWQAGVDALVAGRADAALRAFHTAYQSATTRAAQGSLGRWLALCLLELDRVDEAMAILEDGAAMFVDHPDYAYLAALGAAMSGRSLDVAAVLAQLHAVGEGSRYDDWFAAPEQLLWERLG